MNRKDALTIFSKGFNKFIERKGYTRETAGKLLGCKEGNISKIKAGNGFPSVEGIFTLIEDGMKLEEIFGTELAEKLLEGLKPVPGLPEHLRTPEINEIVAKALTDIIAKGAKG